MTNLNAFLYMLTVIQKVGRSISEDEDVCMAVAYNLLLILMQHKQEEDEDTVRKTGKIGKIEILKDIGRGFFSGKYENTDVVVKKVEKKGNKKIFLENVGNYRFVPIYGKECTEKFAYYALKPYVCCLEQYIEDVDCWEEKEEEKEEGKGEGKGEVKGEEKKSQRKKSQSTTHLLSLMYDIVCGVDLLHKKSIVHGNLRLESVLIMEDKKALSAKILVLDVDEGYEAWPQNFSDQRRTKANDMVRLGCILFYCLTKGRVPEYMPKKMAFNTDALEGNPEAHDLISSMLELGCGTSESVEKRLQILSWPSHPMFWNALKRLSFIKDVSDLLESNKTQHLKAAVNGIGQDVLTPDEGWMSKIGEKLCWELLQCRTYGDNVVELLRFIRNTVYHYSMLNDPELLIGDYPNGMNKYFSERWPQLVMKLFHALRSFEKDPLLKIYFISY